MVLYTPLHHDEIFPTEEQLYEIVSYQGKPCYVKKGEDGTYELIRLLSTDPQDYLNGNLQPGTIIGQPFY